MQQLRLPKLLGEGCVLQRGDAAKIWGWCRPCEEVEISLKGQVRRTRADEKGRFWALLPLPKPGGPYVLQAKTAAGEQAENGDLYVGEVFVCAGQSNMELPMRRVRERYPEEFENGGAPFVHLYKVAERYEFAAPLSDHEQAEWTVCVPERLEEISALSYFVGKQLQERLEMPVGILNLSLGGTPVEAWISRKGLEGLPEYLELADEYRDVDFRRKQMRQKEAEEAAWYAGIAREEARVPEDAWKPFELPGYLEDAGLPGFCGSILLRRTFEIPRECAGRQGFLQLGTMTDSDRTCINGRMVGETGYSYPPRRYRIPEGLLREGTNEITVHLICRDGRGRVTPGKPYRIMWEDPGRTARGMEEKGAQALPVDLAGRWEYRICAVTDRAPEQEFINRKPTGLFQGMAAPCLPFRVRGAVWYQGESNDGRPENYGELLCRMIRDWRDQWEQENLPFVIVQLPNCGIDIAPGDAWPKIREAQRSAGRLSDTAVTVNLDLGEDNDLHPLNKKEVAQRIVLAIRGMIYKESIAFSGPEPVEWEVRGKEVLLTFDAGEGGGLIQKERIPLYCGRTEKGTEGRKRDGAPEEKRLFELAGADGRYCPAKAVVSGSCVKLTSDAVEVPCFVRYAWSDAPCGPLLYNESGLPAGPFAVRLTGTRHMEKEGERHEEIIQ